MENRLHGMRFCISRVLRNASSAPAMCPTADSACPNLRGVFARDYWTKQKVESSCFKECVGKGGKRSASRFGSLPVQGFAPRRTLPPLREGICYWQIE